MKRIFYITIFLYFLVLFSCGNGPTFLYNWRPKPWLHSYVANTYTGLDTLINTNGYYVSQTIDTTYFLYPTIGGRTNKKTEYFRIDTNLVSVMFYNDGLCIGSRKSIRSECDILPILDTLYSSLTFSTQSKDIFYKKHEALWGTYKLCNDTIKVFLIKDTSATGETRKNVISEVYIISSNQELKQTFISNTSKEYGYEKILDTPYSTFYPIENKRDSTECPYLINKWFYKKDKVK